jgi:hypothetical protein
MAEVMNKTQLTRVSQHCKPEIEMWKSTSSSSIEKVLNNYFNLAVHLLCELADARHQLPTISKAAPKSDRTEWARSAFNYMRLLIENKDKQNWVLARDVFGCGRTEAVKFCKELNINPDNYTW